MTVRLSPQAALYGDERPLPSLPPCVHYAGSERFIAKALELQRAKGPAFDVAGDCEDGAPIGGEIAHARMIAGLIQSEANAHGRFGARIHDVRHAAWHSDLEILVGEAGDRIAFLTLPKAETAVDVERTLEALTSHAARRGLGRSIPLSVLIENSSPVVARSAISRRCARACSMSVMRSPRT